ncbi:shugoshin 1 [Solea senegalensis]|uniref:Shugoshin 1 n=1 Tax=Solea senegalensis TaxID=28829 RepID=A0AAV6R3F0_SOLSE|nr:shugoshin 1 [Solea senegalensis]KAG7500054.1 shugoshin 1 [Solea senegalensis]
MGKERAQKKSFQQSLEDIKEKMKEKRNRRLASASAPSKGRSRITNRNSVANTTHTILKGVQLNNKALAVALQAEKERVRQGNAVILQLKREQQALFLHLLLLKKKLKEQEALAALKAAETKPAKVPVEPQHHINLTGRKLARQNVEEPNVFEDSPIRTEPRSSEKSGQSECYKQMTLPPSVGVRRQHTDRKNKRRSERVQKRQSLSEGDTIAGMDALKASPIHGDDKILNQVQQRSEPEMAHVIDTEDFQHSTPEPVPNTKKTQQSNRKQAQLQPRTKTEPAPRKAERGRRPERAQMKKPWENPKPRARSKSRDRSATRSKTAPPPQSNKLNTSLGFNDTFDFDCEEAVHITPFKPKVDDSQVATPVSEEPPQSRQPVTEDTASRNESSSSSLSSESEDSLYVPQKTKRKQTSPDQTKVITTRRGRPSKVIRQKENIYPKQEISVFRNEDSSPQAMQPEKNQSPLHRYPDSHISNSPNPTEMGKENHQEPHREDLEDCLLPVSPLVEAEMMRIGDVLSNFGDSPSDAPPLLSHQTPKRIKTCRKRGLGIRTAGRGLSLCDVTNMSPAAYRKFPSDARCSTPVPARKRRCTMVVDYKEPSLNAKLRRGDKFTDLQFLRSPIFKQKADRRSEQNSRKSTNGQKQFDMYNESFVGCR